MKAQSKKASIVESLVNVVIGLVVAFVSQQVIFNAYGYHVTYLMNLQLTLWFTAVSIARSFILRRIFNYFTEKRLTGLRVPYPWPARIEVDTDSIPKRKAPKGAKWTRVMTTDGEFVDLPTKETEAISHLTRKVGYEKKPDGTWKRVHSVYCVTCRRPV